MRYRVARPYKKPNSANYWVRIVVLKDLKARVGSGEIQKSLATTDAAEAAILAAEFSIKWKREFKSLRDEIASEELALGRNESCPCGSGKKYKQCHGR